MWEWDYNNDEALPFSGTPLNPQMDLYQRMAELMAYKHGIKDPDKYIKNAKKDGPSTHPPCTIEELLASCGMKEEF